MKKQLEPHPESLLIEPIERPALLSTMPPDWIVDQNHPQFNHTLNNPDHHIADDPEAKKKCFSYEGAFIPHDD